MPRTLTLRQINRLALAEKRLFSVLRAHGVATDRTLEQKISDAGPANQRIDPHILTQVKTRLVEEHRILRLTRTAGRKGAATPWYHLPETPALTVETRLSELHDIHDRTLDHRFTVRLGQTLEIAIFQALETLHAEQPTTHFFGSFRDLDEHDDSTLYSKIEPEAISGRPVSGRSVVDFVLIDPAGNRAAIEAKNVRQWLYPDRQEIRDLLLKSCLLDAVPVLIARRIPYVTFSVLNRCGFLIHQTYNQLYPSADHELAALVKNKRLLGYHDVRLGNQPDERLLRFIRQLPTLLPEARARFEDFRDLLHGYATGDHSYQSFAGRARRRQRGEPQEFEPAEEHEEPEPDWE